MCKTDSKGKRTRFYGQGVRGFTSQMTRVQTIVPLMIMGRIRSTMTDTLNAYTNLLPF